MDAAAEKEEAEALLAYTEYAVVIADLRLTGIYGVEGLDIIQWSRHLRPETRVVLLTGNGTPEIEAEARRRGARRLPAQAAAAPRAGGRVVAGLTGGRRERRCSLPMRLRLVRARPHEPGPSGRRSSVLRAAARRPPTASARTASAEATRACDDGRWRSDERSDADRAPQQRRAPAGAAAGCSWRARRARPAPAPATPTPREKARPGARGVAPARQAGQPRGLPRGAGARGHRASAGSSSASR